MSRVLCIGDLHEPFCLEGYLDFCVDIYNSWDCDRIVFIGDVIDNHFSSYHETDADGLGGMDELDLAIEKLKPWHDTFPDADVTIGNHDRMIMRKAQSSNIPTHWIKEYKDALNTPSWNFTERVVVDNVQYIHGEGGTARSRCIKDMQSTIQGHLHTQCYSEWKVGSRARIFGAQVGCGIDKDAYAMAYAKNFPKPAIACLVCIDGETVINEMMPL